ncbi:hypothetical protein AQUCO_00100221v1 [Aquilegia coerulea]|uniref:Oxidative stress 3 n=1 Tax=Aquilegia coerulea TaxID=218851 RepID=A0A2G5F9H7_AQUCA|nr:hypothetical protein AQUCO_00100221v1 [Aquilegia coerulea]
MITMAASKYGMFSDPILMGMNNSSTPTDVQQNSWGIIDDNMYDSSESTMSSSFDNSTNSGASSLSLELVEDASSSYNSSLASSPQLNKGPLYELSDLMAQLPIKRGLSMHFQGKSQSFTSLSQVRSVEDLVKRENPYKKRMKSCKSYGGLDGNNTNNKSFAPKACSKIISKKVSRGSFLSSLGKKNSLNNSPRSPFSLEKNF